MLRHAGRRLYPLFMLLPLFTLPMAAAAEGSDAPRWVVTPGETGPDLPPEGRSLFDFLFSSNGEDGPHYAVPFPFASLRQRISAQLQEGDDGIRQVLIPLGRSLQRLAAGAEFARYPRLVLAVNGEPARDAVPRRLLRDRLYIGYQEKAGILEVISYNEAAGRFEFQVVENYRAGGTPQVRYANRTLCVACHQNAAPIFSRPLWGETNADARIAALLGNAQRDFYGLPVKVGVDIPNAIDDATDRANRISTTQWLWRYACGAGLDSAAVRACRGRALRFALLYRLTGRLAFAESASADWRALRATLEQQWQTQWPQGLWIPNPDIANRIPSPDRLEQPLPPALDPLRLREPLEHWQGERLAERFITGLADMFAAADVRELDRALQDRARGAQLPERHYHSDCGSIRERRRNQQVRLTLRCTPPGKQPASEFSMEGRLYLQGERLQRGVLDSLTLPQGDVLRAVPVSAGRLEAAAGRLRLVLELANEAGTRRAADGAALRVLTLEAVPSGEAQEGDRSFPAAAQARLAAVQDTAILTTLLEQEVEGDARGGTLFRRADWMQLLVQSLGMPASGDCCLDTRTLPEAEAAAAPVSRVSGGAAAAVGDEAGFYTYCAICHGTDNAFPPNFLHGDPEQVRARLDQCAERIAVRLAMWEQPPAARSKTAMPPMTALHGFGVSAGDWIAGGVLRDLRRYIQGRLDRQGGGVPPTARVYESLRPCLDTGAWPAMSQDEWYAKQQGRRPP